MLHNQCLKLLAVSVGAMGLGSIPRPSAGSSADVFLFPYFQNNGNSGITLSDSTNGINFSALNGGNPIFTPPASFGSQNLTRDPAIIYQNGIFDMVWTSNWTGNVFGFAQSTNLKDWTNVREIQPFTGTTQPVNVSAPEIQYNLVANNYVIIFSSALTQSTSSAVAFIATPEPATLGIFALGSLGLLAGRSRRRRR